MFNGISESNNNFKTFWAGLNLAFLLFFTIGLISIFFFNTSINSFLTSTNLEIQGLFYKLSQPYYYLYQQLGIAYVLIFLSGFFFTKDILFKKFRNYSNHFFLPSFLGSIVFTPILFASLYIFNAGVIGQSLFMYIKGNFFYPINYLIIALSSIMGFVFIIISLDIPFFKVVKAFKFKVSFFKALITWDKEFLFGFTKKQRLLSNVRKKLPAKKSSNKTSNTKTAPRATTAKIPTSKEKLMPLPTLNLLGTYKKDKDFVSKDVLLNNASMLKGFLEEFKIFGDITNIRPGPVVTLYEFKPNAGIRASSVISLADDIARHMSAMSARIAVVQGKNVIGIELPNLKRKTVFFKEQLENPAFVENSHTLCLALGQDIGGKPVYVDLAKMPHLLIAGTTGSGKSVGVNGMIISLLYKFRPDECKFIMIDPKMLEFSIFNDIPHLLTPVVTDPAKAVVALKWAVREMENRYKQMANIGSKNIESFNKKVDNLEDKKYTKRVQVGFNPETGEAIFERKEFEYERMPYLVVIVDEMADLMLVAGKDVEASIQRLAQMARAAGIHLILSTQRPSADVITGVIKANFPTRISFRVTNAVNSRVIIDSMGGEKLLGRGDMLYFAGGGKLTRVHGAFVDEPEIHKVANFWRKQAKPNYVTDVVEESDGKDGNASLLDKTLFKDDKKSKDNDLYKQAVQIVLEKQKASISFVQRSLRIGYNRAADLVDRMEQDGILSAPSTTGKREILKK